MNLECLICNTKNFTDKKLTRHLNVVHKIDKVKYLTDYMFKDNIPLCACGCGQNIKLVRYYPYLVRKYIAGHNSRGITNPRYKAVLSEDTLEKMRISAKLRMESYQNDSIPMHDPEAIKKRAQVQTNKFIHKIQDEFNVTILDRIPTEKFTIFKFKCNVCGEEKTQSHQVYFRCSKCFPNVRSRMENELTEELKKLFPSLEICQNNRNIMKDGREIDIFIPSKNLAIEFNGLYWHGELNGKDKWYHISKTKECEKNGIRLIHIFEDEWIHNKTVILNRIRALLDNDSRKRIFARKTKVAEISAAECREFLKKYHLQSTDSAPIRYGLFYENNLIQVMTFSKQNASRGKRSNLEGTYELSRLCTHSDYVCVGGASKLLNHFISEHNPVTIITYADRRYSSILSNVYIKMGFEFSRETSPSYWYFKHNENIRYHRFNFTKKKTVMLGGDQNFTEWENMKNLGFDRIWDCGTLRYEMRLK